MNTYTTASNARRAAKAAGFTIEQVTILPVGDRFGFQEIVAAPVIIEIASEEAYGQPDGCCPHCSVHLSNGVGEHKQEVNGGLVRHTKFEFECLACGEEFGAPIGKKAPRKERVAGEAKEHDASTIPRPTKAVWGIAQNMPGAKRAEVIQACVAQGIAFNTARTQYQQWSMACRGIIK